jgi:hypothetical protein
MAWHSREIDGASEKQDSSVNIEGGWSMDVRRAVRKKIRAGPMTPTN